MSDLLARLHRDAARAGLPETVATGAVVTPDDVAALPEVVRRYLAFMGAVGRPRDVSVRGRFTGRFRTGPSSRWLRFDAWQYGTADPVTRLFHMRLSVGPLGVLGSDDYVAGRGRMHARLLGLVTVADGTGAAFDLGELVTYVNDCVLLAPSMLLVPAATWSEAGDSSFDVTLTDRGNTVTARVTVDERGAPTGFRTTDRWAAIGGELVRAPWSTPVAGWTVAGGRPVPSYGRALWELETGEFAYVEGALEPATVEWNVPAGAPEPARRLRATRSAAS